MTRNRHAGLLWLAAMAATLAARLAVGEGIPIEVLEPDRRVRSVRDFPVSIGLVFPDGELKGVPGGRLVDDAGQDVAFEAEATGWWDKAKTRVRWLLLHFRAHTARRYSFVPGGRPTPTSGRELATVTLNF